ncbi:hypothetical protein R6Q59_031864 [Mikania micrantha]
MKLNKIKKKAGGQDPKRNTKLGDFTAHYIIGNKKRLYIAGVLVLIRRVRQNVVWNLWICVMLLRNVNVLTGGNFAGVPLKKTVYITAY